MTATSASLIWRVGTEAGRVCLCMVAVLLHACGAPVNARAEHTAIAATGDFEIILGREAIDDRPVLVVMIKNRSEKDICIVADTLQNPYSYGMELRLRDARGRAVGYHREGFIPPPQRGVVRVEPSRSVRAQYYLDARFRRIGPRRPFPRGLRAQASFRYGYCDDVWSLQARSTWQPI